MNAVFTILIISSLCLAVYGGVDNALPSMLKGATAAITLSVKLLAIYTVWLSFLQLLEKSGINKFVYKLFKPFTNRLFKGESAETQTLIGMNLASNFLGLGGAGTPLAIKAIQNMEKEGSKASHNMIALFVINATSIQLLPTTIIAMRAAAGSSSPSDIILPTLLATIVTSGLGVSLCLICRNATKRKHTQTRLSRIFAVKTRIKQYNGKEYCKE